MLCSVCSRIRSLPRNSAGRLWLGVWQPAFSRGLRRPFPLRTLRGVGGSVGRVLPVANLVVCSMRPYFLFARAARRDNHLIDFVCFGT